MWSSYLALGLTLIILLTNGFSVFTKGNWDPETFVASYLYVNSLPIPYVGRAQADLNSSDIPLVISAYLIWKFLKKTKIYTLSEIPLDDALKQADLEQEATYRD